MPDDSRGSIAARNERGADQGAESGRRTGPDGTIVRPYGDTTGDGMVQTSFTLPVPPGPKADGAALQLATKMGIEPAMVVHSHGIGAGGGRAGEDAAFTFFVVYGSVKHLVDLDAVQVEERAYPLLSPSEVNAAIRPSSSTASRSTVSARRSMKPPFGGAKSSTRPPAASRT